MTTRLFILFCVLLGFAPAAYSDPATSAAPALSTVQRAESTVAVTRDKDGCTITRASNSRLSPVGVDSYRNTDSLNLILHETFERSDNDCLEQVQGKVTVDATVYDRDFKNPKSLWSFTTEGWEGGPEPEGHWSLYGVTMPGCCGASDTDSYFSLWTGKRLFASTGPILSLEVPNSGGVLRFVGLLDNAASMAFKKESGGADDAIGVLYFSSDREPGETLVLHGHKGDAYHYADLKFMIRGKTQKDRQLDLWSADKSKDPKSITGFSIRGALECECDRPLLTFEVPVVDGHMGIKGAKASDSSVTFSGSSSN
ncbi:MAG: hypothetical protein ACHQAU_01545 [Gammaproteobacteria bacterium]